MSIDCKFIACTGRIHEEKLLEPDRIVLVAALRAEKGEYVPVARVRHG